MGDREPTRHDNTRSAVAVGAVIVSTALAVGVFQVVAGCDPTLNSDLDRQEEPMIDDGSGQSDG